MKPSTEAIELVKLGWNHRVEMSQDNKPSDVFERTVECGAVSYLVLAATCAPFEKPSLFVALRRSPSRNELAAIRGEDGRSVEPIANTLVLRKGTLAADLERALVDLERTAKEIGAAVIEVRKAPR